MAVPVLCLGLARFIGRSSRPFALSLLKANRNLYKKWAILFFTTFRPYKIACFSRPTAKCLTQRVCVGQLWRRRSLALSLTHTVGSLSGEGFYYTRTRSQQTRLVNGVLASIFLQQFCTRIFTSVALYLLAGGGIWRLRGLWGFGTARFYL